MKNDFKLSSSIQTTDGELIQLPADCADGVRHGLHLLHRRGLQSCQRYRVGGCRGVMVGVQWNANMKYKGGRGGGQ